MKNFSTTFRLFSILLSLALVSTACMKKQNLKEEDLGVAFSRDEVAIALFSAFGPFNFSEIRPLESYRIASTERVQGGSTQTAFVQDVVIYEINDGVIDPNKLYLDIDLLTNTGSTPGIVKSGIVSFTKPSGISGVAFVDDTIPFLSTEDRRPLFLFEILQRIAFTSCITDEDYQESCHKLTTKAVQKRLPSGSEAQKATCPSTPDNCLINATQIEFDIIRHKQPDDDNRPDRVHYTFVISQDTPFTARVLELCSRALYPTESGGKLLADVCYSVRDYTFGDQ
ncbi:hypothetical protein [Pseudobdellovibrio exovorus]|uniref:Lipoprotein n=1 Tax=Pseudobdellovibrio exovorus JSS TaxID=1184267 RepID=M4VE41_9BACT|nr:hypothetical protein [Pseudobdellovibrio exovorus]AGH96311.1 hypothetical protein A11Q_2095 [Pseudobdellovibrio exovorus JSS]